MQEGTGERVTAPEWGSKERWEDKASLKDQTIPSLNPSSRSSYLKGSRFQGFYINS